MIPKKIHYCWFGGNPLPEDTLRYIDSWKKHCPDYEIIEWNESNFDINQYSYAREAYEHKKYAFVSDVARLYALVQEGGIYLDTDVEMLKPLDAFLEHTAFTCFEKKEYLASAIIGGEMGCQYAVDQLASYERRRFVQPDGSLDMTANVVGMTQYMVERGLRLDNAKQDFPGLLTVYPLEYFCPKRSEITGYKILPKEAHTIHYFMGTWQLRSTPEYLRLRKKYKIIPYFIRKKLILAILGETDNGFFSAMVRLKKAIFKKR